VSERSGSGGGGTTPAAALPAATEEKYDARARRFYGPSPSGDGRISVRVWIKVLSRRARPL
jgi:hypothetical protein